MNWYQLWSENPSRWTILEPLCYASWGYPSTWCNRLKILLITPVWGPKSRNTSWTRIKWHRCQGPLRGHDSADTPIENESRGSLVEMMALWLPREWPGVGHRPWWSPQLELWALMVQECQSEVVKVLDAVESDKG